MEEPENPDAEMDRIRREADQIDVHQYRKRFRAMKAIALGAALAGVVWLVLIMLDSRRNPCERVRDHYCKADPASPQCQTYETVLRESIDNGPAMRGNVRAQCQSKIDRLKEEDGVNVR
jgi:hypothetical protein